MKNTVILTGAAGFIGSNLVDYLLEHTDYNIIGIDDFSTGERSNLPENPRFRLVVGRCGNTPYHLPEDIKAVFHLAAKISVSDSFLDPRGYHDGNASESMAILNFCKNKKIPLIFSSSNAVYGNATAVSMHSPKPISPYALTKRYIEQMGEMISKQYNFPFITLRYTNVFGPRQRSSGAYGNIFSAWMTKIKNKETELPVYGDGFQTRDYVYVKDICQANLKALEYNKSNTFDVGSGRNLSVNEVFDLFAKEFPGITKLNLPRRAGDIDSTCSFTQDKTVTEFGYSPTDFDQAISETMKWYNKNFI